MSSLGAPKGYFSLSNGNENVGSFISAHDLFDILEIDLASESDFVQGLSNLGIIRNDGYVDENDVYKKLDSIKNLYSSKKHKKAISFDEYVLKALIRRAIPDATIIQQAVIPELGKRSAVDFYVEKEGNGLYLEFDGTSHFAKLGLYEVRDSRDKKAKTEDVTGKECVCWPLWIQRCEQNVKVLFDDTICGHGTLWSTKYLFGNFCIDRPSELIIQETKRFNAIHKDGLGYFYGYNENETRMMPKHSVISQILKGKKPLTSIIPHDIHDHFEYWLPSVLWPLL